MNDYVKNRIGIRTTGISNETRVLFNGEEVGGVTKVEIGDITMPPHLITAVITVEVDFLDIDIDEFTINQSIVNRNTIS